MLKAAIVILNWNGKKFLEQFLPVLIEKTKEPGTEIIVADNKSEDSSIDFLNEFYPAIRQVLLDKNYGFAGGYNKALREIEAEYFVLLNSDIEVSNNWLQPLISLMDSDKKIAACQPKIKSFFNQDSFEYAGAAGGCIDKYGYPFCRGRILDKIESDLGQYDDFKEIFWATGACMIVRSDIFNKLDGFDGDFFAHMEEIDLCWRMKNQGYKVMYCPESVVYHIGGGTLPNNSPFKLYLNYRNNLFLLYKNLPKDGYCRVIFIRMLLDGLSAVIFLFKFSFSNFTSVIKAHFHFYKSLNKLKIKRKCLLLNVLEKKHKEIYPKSILFSYFIKGIKEFNNLNF